MGRRSTIEQLPPELSDLCHRLIREGRTIEDITEKLNELDADVSRSAVGRYVKGAREQMKNLREAQTVASQWVRQINENPQGDVSALLTDLLSSLSYQVISTMTPDDNGGGKRVKPMDIMLLAKAIRDLEATSKANIERREKIERAVLERQAQAAEKVAKQQGMSADQWAQIRAQFLGIKDEAA